MKKNKQFRYGLGIFAAIFLFFSATVFAYSIDGQKVNNGDTLTESIWNRVIDDLKFFGDNIRFLRGDTITDAAFIGGNVGIGTMDPGEALHINKSDAVSAATLYTNFNSGENSTDGLWVGYSDASYVWNYEDTNLQFATNNAPQMTIDPTGNVGIGTTSPTAELDVVTSGGGTLLNIRTSAGSSNNVGLSIGGARTSSSANDISYIDLRNETSSAYTFARITGYDPSANHALQNGGLHFYTSNGGTLSKRITIRHDGKVGIGKTSPEAMLDVNGGIKLSDDTDTCDATKEGTTRYNSTEKKLELCDGTSWTSTEGSGGGTTTPEGFTEIYQNLEEDERVLKSDGIGAGPDDTCDGDKDNAYVCPTKAHKYCLDVIVTLGDTDGDEDTYDEIGVSCFAQKRIIKNPLSRGLTTGTASITHLDTTGFDKHCDVEITTPDCTHTITSPNVGEWDEYKCEDWAEYFAFMPLVSCGSNYLTATQDWDRTGTGSITLEYLPSTELQTISGTATYNSSGVFIETPLCDFTITSADDMSWSESESFVENDWSDYICSTGRVVEADWQRSGSTGPITIKYLEY